MFMFGIGIQEILILAFVILIPLVILVLWIWTLVDIIKSEFAGSNKIVWTIIVLLLPLIGMILYYFIGKNQKIKSKAG